MSHKSPEDILRYCISDFIYLLGDCHGLSFAWPVSLRDLPVSFSLALEL